MLRLAFDFIITWRETRTRPNAYFLYACVWYPTRVVRQSHPGEIAASPRWNWSLTGVEYQMKVVVITDGNGCYTLSDRTGDSLRLQQIAKSMRLITTSSHLGTLIFVVIL